MGLKPPNPPHPLATAGPSPGVLDAGHNSNSVSTTSTGGPIFGAIHL